MTKKERRAACECHFGDDDIVINGIRLNNVHLIPDNPEENVEIDYYMDNGDDMYLLRLINNDKYTVNFVPGEITYVIAEIPFTDIDKELEYLCGILGSMEIPVECVSINLER